MITRRTKVQLLIFVLITLIGVRYVGARYARLDRFFFDDAYTVVGALPRLRRHLRRRRGVLPRRHGRPGRGAGAHRRRRRRPPGHRERRRRRSRPTPSPWSATAPRSASSTSSSSRRSTTGPTSTTAPRSRSARHRAPRSRPEAARRPHQHRRVRRQGATCAPSSTELGTAFEGTGRGPRPDHRHQQRLHRDRQRQLRRHHAR